MAENELCGLDRRGDGTYTAKGIIKLCKGLKGSAVTSLKCAAAPECSPSCQRPLTRTCLLTVPPTIPCSIANNRIGDKGASALAAILKETMISTLRCASASGCSFLSQHPLTHGCSLTILAPQLTRSLCDNHIGDKGASALAAVLKETQITDLKCAAALVRVCQRPLTHLLSSAVWPTTSSAALIVVAAAPTPPRA